jgi:O-antigen/teichoic acid export membrane protein
VYAITWVSVLAIPSILGMDVLLVREVSSCHIRSDSGRLRGVLLFALVLVLFGSVVLALSAFAATWVFRGSLDENMLRVFWLALLLLPLSALNLARQSVLRGLRRMVAAQLPDVIGVLIMVLLVFLIARGSGQLFDAQHAVLINLFSVTITFVLGWYLLRRALASVYSPRLQPQYDIGGWLGAIPFLLFISGVQILNAKVDVLMLGWLDNVQNVGIYTVASNAAGLLVFVLGAANMVLAPEISGLHATGNTDRLQQTVTLVSRAVFILTLPLMLVLVFGASWYLNLFGTDFLAGHTAMLILCVAQSLNVAMGSVGVLLLMTGYEREAGIGMGMAVLLNITLNLLLIPVWGMNGAAAASALSIICWNLILLVLVIKRLAINPTILGRGRCT